eukprot:SAG31_NODE_78_length_27447_cov_83.819877_3_plen_231_part_00
MDRNDTFLMDSSPYSNDATSEGAVVDGAFCRGRGFVEDGPQGINIASHPSIEFGSGSFSVMGWARFESYEYPRTSFVAKNGHGCYFHQAHEHESGVARAGWNPGWEIGHSYVAEGANVCIRDDQNNKFRGNLIFNEGNRPPNLLGRWVHYAFVFDRETEHQVCAYVDGVRQSHCLDISGVIGSIDNPEPLTFGTLYGWKTDGALDEYRVYDRTLNDGEVREVVVNGTLPC